MDSTYMDLQAARADGAVTRGWIPDWIPATSVEIFEAHNADTNASMLAARYDENESVDWSGNCERVDPMDPAKPPFEREWWPSDVPASPFITYRHVFLKCGEHSYAAFGKGEFYFWRTGASE
jgi:hypothetical protein